MKKSLFVLIVFSIMVSKAFSQTTTGNQSFGQKLLSKMEFGLTAGGNVSNFTDANFPTNILPGFQAGITVAYKFTDNFMVQEEFLYAMQGAKVKGGVFGTNDVKLSYASVPILLKYRTSSGFFVEAGPQAGYKIKEDIGGVTDAKYFKKVDFGVTGGLGYKSSIGLGVDARYIYGLQKIQETPSASLGDFKNNSIQASIFYVF